MSDEIKKSKEYKLFFKMEQPHAASGEEINGYARNVCASHAQGIVNGWNDGPEDHKYTFDHVDLVRIEDQDSDTHCDAWPSNKCSWEFTGNAIYNIYYK